MRAAKPTGYRHPDYARSFAELGEPVWLEGSGSWVLRRMIGRGPHRDLTGPYPLLLSDDFSRVADDLFGLDRDNLASAVFVTDPFCDRTIEMALQGFDCLRPFKRHYVASLDHPWRSFASRRCRRYARAACAALDIRAVDDPPSHFGLFWKLFAEVLDRPGVVGPHLSERIVAAHFRIPGLKLFEARDSDGVLGAGSFFEVGDRVYAHLLGMSRRGRERRATYGIYGAALDFYQHRARYVDFGGVAGPVDDPNDGLSHFKRGWADHTRTAFVCGKVLNRRLYDELCSARGRVESRYFPAYRAPGPPASRP